MVEIANNFSLKKEFSPCLKVSLDFSPKTKNTPTPGAICMMSIRIGLGACW